MSDWKRKLSSRKLWAAAVGFVTALLTAFGVSDLTAEQVVTVVSALGVLVSYIIGESAVDASTKQESDGE